MINITDNGWTRIQQLENEMKSDIQYSALMWCVIESITDVYSALRTPKLIFNIKKFEWLNWLVMGNQLSPTLEIPEIQISIKGRSKLILWVLSYRFLCQQAKSFSHILLWEDYLIRSRCALKASLTLVIFKCYVHKEDKNKNKNFVFVEYWKIV